MIKTIKKLGVRGTYLDIIKTIYKKKTTIIILNDEKLKHFPLRSEKRQGFPLSPLLFDIVLEVLDRASSQEKEIKGVQIITKELKLCLPAYVIIFHVKNPKPPKQKQKHLLN